MDLHERVRDVNERRAGLLTQMTALVDDDANYREGALTAEKRAEHDRLAATFTDLTSTKTALDRELEARSAAAGITVASPAETLALGTAQLQGRDAPLDDDAQYRAVFRRWAQRGMSDLEADDRQFLGTLNNNAELTQAREQARAAGVGTGAGGGFLVPSGFRRDLVIVQKQFGGMLQVAEIIDTDTGAALPWPTNDDTGNKGAILSENTQITEQDLTLGQAQLGAYMYTSKLVRVSYQLLQDSAFNFEGFLRTRLGERLGRAENEHFTVGTGTGQPQGITVGGVTRVTLAAGNTTGFSTTAIGYNALVDLFHSIDPAYRNERTRWMMNDTTIKGIVKLVDTTGRPVWQLGMQAGEPDTLFGRPITFNQDMPVPAANAKTIAFGDFSAGYVIRMVTGVLSVRLTERYADFLQVGFFAFQRVDGMVQNAAAFSLLAQSAT
jgi:HK97 family phage major capsid protein